MTPRPQTTSTAPTGRSRFFWQGVLIVLPVIVLAILALFSLRQDRSMVELEAREKAQAEAAEIADRLWAALDDPELHAAFQHWLRLRWTPGHPAESEKSVLDPGFLFQVDASGQLIFPPPLLEWPEPHPLDPTDLTDEQAARWREGQRMAADSQSNRTEVAESLRRLIELAPPDRFAAAAHFQRGVLLSREGQPAGALQEFLTVATSFPESSSESGLPLLPFALLKAAEQSLLLTNGSTSTAPVLLHAACSNAVAIPSSVTPNLLRAALPLESSLSTNLVAPWQALWRQHQTQRGLYALARPGFTAAVAEAVRQRTEDRAKALWFPYAVPPQTKEVPPRLFWFALPGRSSVARQLERTPSEFESQFPSGEYWLASWMESDSDGYWYFCRPRFGRFLDTGRTISYTSERVPSLISVGPNTNVENLAPELARPDYPFFDPLLAELEKQRARLPDYLGLTFELGGHVLISSNYLPPFPYASSHKASGPFHKTPFSITSPPLLASAVHVEDGVESLRVGLHLISPERLYARQDARTRLFGLLISVSALAALIGFVSARRAFRRQQQLAELKSNFVSSVSHELRAPIASVRLMAESLERGKIGEPAKQREYFRFIVQECRRLGTLIENVLDFARIEQGRKQYDSEPTDLLALVRQTVQLMEPAAAEREVLLNFIPPPPTKSVSDLHPSLDGAALQQALINLLDNAIKHSPSHTTVAVALEFTSSPAWFKLSVQDAGPGIPPAEHEKIFERFYRRGSELRRETQGVGIGLSIVKHVAEAHGGHVRVESDVGKGSRFVIELPMNPGQARGK